MLLQITMVEQIACFTFIGMAITIVEMSCHRRECAWWHHFFSATLSCDITAPVVPLIK